MSQESSTFVDEESSKWYDGVFKSGHKQRVSVEVIRRGSNATLQQGVPLYFREALRFRIVIPINFDCPICDL